MIIAARRLAFSSFLLVAIAHIPAPALCQELTSASPHLEISCYPAHLETVQQLKGELRRWMRQTKDPGRKVDSEEHVRFFY